MVETVLRHHPVTDDRSVAQNGAGTVLCHRSVMDDRSVAQNAGPT